MRDILAEEFVTSDSRDGTCGRLSRFDVGDKLVSRSSCCLPRGTFGFELIDRPQTLLFLPLLTVYRKAIGVEPITFVLEQRAIALALPWFVWGGHLSHGTLKS